MRGFTVLEIIIVIGIFSVISALGIQPLLALKNKNALIRAAEEGASLLAEARARTLSSKNASRYGVRFAPDRTVLFRGDSFSANDPENETVFLRPAILSPLVSLSGGGVDVIFKRLTGETDEYGTIVFWLKKNPEMMRTITVEKTGVVSVE